MKTIILGFSTRKDRSPFSILIRLITKSRVSHVYVRIPIPAYNTNMIFQASGLKVNYEFYDLFLQKEIIIEEYEIAVSDEQYAKSELFRITEAGKDYSMKEIFGLGYVLFMRQALKKRVSNPLSQGNQAYICVDVGACQIGYEDSGNLTPEDLRRWCKSRYTPTYSIL